MEVRFDFAGFDAILDVGFDPILHGLRNLAAAMYQRDPGLVPVQLQRRDGRGVLGSDYDYVLIVIGVRFLVVVQDLVEVFARHTEHVRNVIIAGGEHNLPRSINVVATQTIGGGDFERSIRPADSVHALVLMDVQLVVIGDAAVVFQSFGAAGLPPEAGHGNVADLEQLWRCEEYEVRRIVGDRVDDAALLNQDCL